MSEKHQVRTAVFVCSFQKAAWVSVIPLLICQTVKPDYRSRRHSLSLNTLSKMVTFFFFSSCVSKVQTYIILIIKAVLNL